MSDCFDTTCDGCIACVTFLLHETCLLLVSLFYGKCYVTMFIREYVAFSYRYWGKFLPKQMRRNCLESCFFIENVGFFFSFVSRIDFFLSVSFRYILYFFWVVNDLSDFLTTTRSTKLFKGTTCDGCIACVTFFLHETSLLLVSLFYGKCYVTIFIREYVAFSYRYWGKFLPK